MTDPLTLDLEAIERRHYEESRHVRTPYCGGCWDRAEETPEWPCDASVLISALQAAEEEAQFQQSSAAMAVEVANKEHDRAEQAEAEAAVLSERIGVLEGALRFYADEANYDQAIKNDRGEWARAALAHKENES